MYESLNGGLPWIDAMFPLDAIICIYTMYNAQYCYMTQRRHGKTLNFTETFENLP